MIHGKPAGDLISPAENTWCPGCGNFSIEHMMKSALAELSGSEGIPLEKFVLVGGIGCHGKLVDYLTINSYYAIHGRAIPLATGIAIANPDLRVICFVGDGDTYAEGLGHLIFAAKRNADITVVVHDNRVYGLTTGQYTPTSPYGFRGRSTPDGITERPINPLELMLVSGATFISRGYTKRLKPLKETFKEAILHEGFSFVEVLQICATYFNLTDCYNEQVYEIADEGLDTADFSQALAVIREWDYTSKTRIPLGTFYRKQMPVFGEKFQEFSRRGKSGEEAVRDLLEGYR